MPSTENQAKRSNTNMIVSMQHAMTRQEEMRVGNKLEQPKVAVRSARRTDAKRATWEFQSRGARGGSLGCLFSAFLQVFSPHLSRLQVHVDRDGTHARRQRVLLQRIPAYSVQTVSSSPRASVSEQELTGTPGSPCTFHLLIMSLANESNTTSAIDTPACSSYTTR